MSEVMDNEAELFDQEDTRVAAPTNEDNSDEMSLEKIFMIENEEAEGAKGDGPQKDDGDGNDRVRYQYQQSRADRAEQRVQALEEQLSQAIEIAQQNSQQNQQFEDEIEELEFPDPPERPRRPRDFNREDAYSDPSSASARYLDELDSYQDDLADFNELKSQYNEARLETLQEQLVGRQQMIEEQIVRSQQLSGVKQRLNSDYGFSQQMADEFVQKYSDPNSVTMENLIKLFMLDKGIPIGSRSGKRGKQTSPSQSFQQAQRAQQVAPSMGVMPARRQPTTEGEIGGSFMDAIIAYDKQTNPFDTIK